MLDCACLAGVAALRHYRRPDVEVVGEDVIIVSPFFPSYTFSTVKLMGDFGGVARPERSSADTVVDTSHTYLCIFRIRRRRVRSRSRFSLYKGIAPLTTLFLFLFQPTTNPRPHPHRIPPPTLHPAHRAHAPLLLLPYTLRLTESRRD